VAMRAEGAAQRVAAPGTTQSYKYASGMCEREAQCPAPNTVDPAAGQCEPPKVLTIILEGGTSFPMSSSFNHPCLTATAAGS